MENWARWPRQPQRPVPSLGVAWRGTQHEDTQGPKRMVDQNRFSLEYKYKYTYKYIYIYLISSHTHIYIYWWFTMGSDDFRDEEQWRRWTAPLGRELPCLAMLNHAWQFFPENLSTDVLAEAAEPNGRVLGYWRYMEHDGTWWSREHRTRAVAVSRQRVRLRRVKRRRMGMGFAKAVGPKAVSMCGLDVRI